MALDFLVVVIQFLKSDSLDIFVSNSNSHAIPNFVCNYEKLNHMSITCPHKTNPRGPKANWVPKLPLKLSVFLCL